MLIRNAMAGAAMVVAAWMAEARLAADNSEEVKVVLRHRVTEPPLGQPLEQQL